MQKINILIIEDNPFISNYLSHIISDEYDMKIVGVIDVNDDIEVLGIMEYTNIDIIILDVSVRKGSRFIIYDKIKNSFAKAPILMLSFFSNPKYCYEAFNRGISGYINKTQISDSLIFLIRQIIANNNCFISVLPKNSSSEITNRSDTYKNYQT